MKCPKRNVDMSRISGYYQRISALSRESGNCASSRLPGFSASLPLSSASGPCLDR